MKPHFKSTRHRRSWRDYQHQLQRPKRAFKRRWVIGIIFSLIACYTLWAGLGLSAIPDKSRPAKPTPETTRIDVKDVRLLLAHLNPQEQLSERIELPISNQHLQIKTSLNGSLQAYLLGKMDRKNSSRIGIVVMDANTGRILAMAGFNKTNPDENPCLDSTFPAASIFKIVTAAAAVDHCGYEASTTMYFNGYKHTLYKNQLKERINRHTNAVSLENAFAQSINPVFGKLGVLKLGKSVLEEYATAFGFNQPIEFDLPLEASSLQIKPTAYHWAEIASGFNRETTLSPIHGAMMVSASLNSGLMVTPSVVDKIRDQNGELLYEKQAGPTRRAMTSRAADILFDLMETTVRNGTARKPFRSQRRHRILSNLQIGGKTGSIYNRTHDNRFDWFVGFAKEKKGPQQLAIAVLVAHQEYIGIRATEYARMAMVHYFKEQLALRDGVDKASGG